jgi:pimeloyl-ACP methyl ester carboxylesterase
LERFTQDAEEMVNYLCKRLGKDKIFVLGYSWGSFLGIHLAKHMPERIHAYISLGQMGLDWVDKSFTRLMHLVNQSGNPVAINELESIMPFPDIGEAWPKKKYRTFLKWARMFNGGWYGKPDLELFFCLQEWAPEYTEADLEIFLKRTEDLTKIMIPLLDDINFEAIGFEFQIPMFIFQGRNDLHTSYAAARDYFDHLQAPYKKFITFERSAHFPLLEEPGRFLMTLVNEVLPMAGEPVYFKPLDDAAE